MEIAVKLGYQLGNQVTQQLNKSYQNSSILDNTKKFFLRVIGKVSNSSMRGNDDGERVEFNLSRVDESLTEFQGVVKANISTSEKNTSESIVVEEH